jgi:hypothetical protein
VVLVINVLVTLVFRASVEAQSGAYATGVLVLILSASLAASLAVTLALWREERRPASLYFGAMTLVFAYTLVDNCVERPDGVIIGSAFILLVLVVSTEPVGPGHRDPVSEADFVDHVFGRARSLAGGQEGAHGPHEGPIAGGPGRGAPIRRNRSRSRSPRAREPPRQLQRVLAPLRVEVRRRGRLRRGARAIAVANTIAYLSELIDPIGIFLGLSRRNLMDQALKFLLFGEGETGLMVYTILLRYWEWTPEDDVRPRIDLLSD